MIKLMKEKFQEISFEFRDKKTLSRIAKFFAMKLRIHRKLCTSIRSTQVSENYPYVLVPRARFSFTRFPIFSTHISYETKLCYIFG